MSIQGKVIIAAQSQLGVIEKGGSDGHSGNIVTYWDWWAKVTGEHDQGASWCAVFVSWCFAQAGVSPLIAVKNKFGFIYCPDLDKWRPKQLVKPSLALPGDVVLFDWTGAGLADHTGIVEKNLGTHLQTIEGNTSGEGIVGSQQNGGGVYRRNRHIDPTIHSIFRPNYPVKLTSLTSTAG